MALLINVGDKKNASSQVFVFASRISTEVPYFGTVRTRIVIVTCTGNYGTNNPIPPITYPLY